VTPEIAKALGIGRARLTGYWRLIGDGHRSFRASLGIARRGPPTA
jgi:hypothetical protein